MCDSVLLMRKYKIKTGTKKHRKDWNLVEKKTILDSHQLQLVLQASLLISLQDLFLREDWREVGKTSKEYALWNYVGRYVVYLKEKSILNHQGS